MENIIFENHFWVTDSQIKALTRNRATNDIVTIISEVSQILYPDDEIEIVFLPSEPWSYKDVIKLVWKTVTSDKSISIMTLVFTILQYANSSAILDNTDYIDDAKKCIDFQKSIVDIMGEWYEISGLEREKIQEVCWNIRIKKGKNDFYKTLDWDESIRSNEVVIAKDSEPIRKNTIPRDDFGKYIEPIYRREELLENKESIIELISPVLLQTVWKWNPWEWIYFWNEITLQWINVISDWERIKFYMQDNDFKKGIADKEIEFTSWDNIVVKLDVKINLDEEGAIQNRNVYVKQVISFNENIIEHKEKLRIKKQKNNNEIMTLFD